MAVAILERAKTAAAVVTCYDLLDAAVSTGICDFTEGMYYGDPTVPYDKAQQNQADYLLDAAGCQAGSQLLDIGCGYGRIVRVALDRGAEAVGITICRAQVEHCRRRGLDVRLLDYRHLPEELNGQFDGIIANGSLEHFVQPRDAAAGEADTMYREMFAICHRLLTADSAAGRFVTTAIHFGSVSIDPHEMLHPPGRFPRGSPEHHYALLVSGFGGYYPSQGQLQRCAEGCFTLVAEEDGTYDYYLTAEHWLAVLKKAASHNPRFIAEMAKKFAVHPKQSARLLDCLLVAQSWNWQFRGPNPPMKLLRQTWQRI